MSASTSHSCCPAHYGRLYGDRGDGWCAASASSDDDWLQVDFGKVIAVCAVATQGDVNGNEWVTDFTMSYSPEGSYWNRYTDKNGVQVVRVFVIYTIDIP